MAAVTFRISAVSRRSEHLQAARVGTLSAEVRSGLAWTVDQGARNRVGANHMAWPAKLKRPAFPVFTTNRLLGLDVVDHGVGLGLGTQCVLGESQEEGCED